jgi:hypothetical protein
MADHARRLPNRVKTAVEAWEKFQRRFPTLDMKKVQIALEEWLPGPIGAPGTFSAESSIFTTLSGAEGLPQQQPTQQPFQLRAIDIVETSLTDTPGRLRIPKQSISLYKLPVR